MNIKERFIRELTRTPEKSKLSLQGLAKRVFVGFFLIMFLLTAVSRAADSATIAKVTVDSVKSGKLTFEAEGTGILKKEAEKYLNLYSGVRVKEISVKMGQNVKKGEVLFQYDKEDLEDSLSSLEDDLAKLQINLEINQLSTDETQIGIDKKEGELILKRAELDLKTAEKELTLAKAEENKEKKEAYELAEKNYEKAVEAYNNQEEKKNHNLEEANHNVSKAEEELERTKEKETKAKKALDDYKAAIYSSDTNLISIGEKNIFIVYYGESVYEDHFREVANAKKALSRVCDDYALAREAVFAGEAALTRKETIAYNRAIEDASEKVKELTQKDTNITEVLSKLRSAIQNNNETDMNNSYNEVLSLIYSEDDNTKKNISDAQDSISEAKAALEDIEREWKITMKTAEETLAEAKEVLSKEDKTYYQILHQTYDYSQDLKAEEDQVKNGKRSVEDARISLEKVRNNEMDVKDKNNTTREISELNQELNEIDIKEKEKKIEEVKKLIHNNGNVLSSVAGIVNKLDLEIGSKITGTEKVSIAFSDYGFEAEITKEEAKHLVPGDEMNIQIGDSKDTIQVPIENICEGGTSGKFIISGILPEGDYQTGNSADFKINKQSELYEETIPIEALRTDGEGKTFVLFISEKNTVLGNQLTALRMNVTVLDKDYKIAAISNELPSENNLIVYSNKYIDEGDRVRVVDSLY